VLREHQSSPWERQARLAAVEQALFHHGSPLEEHGLWGSKKWSKREVIIVIILEAAEQREGISGMMGSGKSTKATSHAGHWRSSMSQETEGGMGEGAV